MNKVQCIHRTSGAVVFGYGQGEPNYYAVYSLPDGERRNHQSLLIGTFLNHKEYTITPIPAFPGEKVTIRLYGGIYLLVGFPPVYGDKAVAVLRAENGNYVEFYIEDIHPIEPTYDVTVKLTKEEIEHCAIQKIGTDKTISAYHKTDTACADKLKEINK